MNQKLSNTTTKVRNALLSRPTEMQNAQNALAIAVKARIQDPNQETLQAEQDALQNLYQVEDKYREGRKLLWIFKLRKGKA